MLAARRHGPKPTVVFDSYWRLAAERQRIFRARLKAANWMTADGTLRRFRFTNSYRASDRTSQFLIRRVIYGANWSWRDTFFRTLLFKLFNRIETWHLLVSALGEPRIDNYDVGAYQRVLDAAMSRGQTLYSAAYIIPPPSTFGAVRKHANHLRLIEWALVNGFPEQIGAASSLHEIYERLLAMPSLGPFLAYQLSIDLNYSDHLRFSESEFVVPGPGAIDGVAKCFEDLGDYSAQDVIQWCADTQEAQFARREIDFDDLWGRPLQYIDCQNLFCEVSKYAREAHPQFAGTAGRVRIKQRFEPRPDSLTAWYPPKWGINSRVAAWLARSTRQNGTGATIAPTAESA